LVLTGNNLQELADLDALQGFEKLVHVSLVENPVTSKEVGTCGVLTWIETDWETTELPLLRSLEMSIDPLPRLSKSQGCRAKSRN
jgi:hypothetical protein